MATQREAYYCLVHHFKNQAEFNSTLQGRWERNYFEHVLCEYNMHTNTHNIVGLNITQGFG